MLNNHVNTYVFTNCKEPMREKKEVFKAFRYGLDLAGKIKKSPPEEVISC